MTTKQKIELLRMDLQNPPAAKISIWSICWTRLLN